MSSLARVFSTILFPVGLNQTIRGSVSVLEPEPSDRGDLLVNSCKASDEAMNIESSGKEGSRRLMSSGMRGVIWLKESGLIKRIVVREVTYSARRKDSQACKQRRADMY